MELELASQTHSSASTQHSTPYRRASRANTAQPISHKQTDYREYLEEDLRHKKTISPEQFFLHILGVDISEPLLDFNERKFTVKLKALDPPTSAETERYWPFIDLANSYMPAAKDSVASESPYFCRNDNSIIRGSHAERKPDVLVVARSAVEGISGRKSASHCRKSGPQSKAPFWWEEVWISVEFGTADHTLLHNFQRTPDYIIGEPPFAHSSAAVTSGDKSQETRRKKTLEATQPTRQQPKRSATTRPQTKSTLPPPPSSDVEYFTGSKRSRNSAQMGSNKKAKLSREELDKENQCASYALEMLSRGVFRTHALGAFIIGNKFQMWYYDRSVVAMAAFDFMNEKHILYRWLKAIRSLKSSGMEGLFHEQSTPPSKDEFSRRLDLAHFGKLLSLPGLPDIVLVHKIFRQHGILGRGTLVLQGVWVDKKYNVEYKWHAEQDYFIVKLSLPSKSRTSEKIFVDQARDAAVGDHSVYLQSLPNIYHECNIEAGVPNLASLFGEEYELRVLRITIQEPLQKIHTITDPLELAQIYVDLIKVHQWLVQYPKILHRDVSMNNLMFRQGHKRKMGVLNDFDLSAKLDDISETTNLFRTGTQPFMALDLLETGTDVQHLPRHDLESFFYVLLWHTSRYEAGELLESPPLDRWSQLPYRELSEAKERMINRAALPPLTSTWSEFTPTMTDLVYVFADGLSASRKQYRKARSNTTSADYDEETQGGNVTYEKVLAPLEALVAALASGT